MPDITPSFLFDGTLCLDPATLKGQPGTQQHFLDKANSYCSIIGRHPGRGWLLLPGSKINEIRTAANAHQPVHQLIINDGKNKVIIPSLVITRIDCLSPSADPNDPNAAYLIEIADARFYAHWSASNKLFNPIDTIKGQLNDYKSPNIIKRADYTDIIDALRKDLPFFLPLTYNTAINVHSLDKEKDLTLSHIAFMGTSAWDCINCLVEKLGHIIAPGNTGTEPDNTLIFSGEMIINFARTELDKTVKEAIAKYPIVDTDNNYFAPTLPATIRVYYHLHDYQYQRSGNLTAQDHWFNGAAADYFDFDVLKLLKNEDATTKEEKAANTALASRIVPGTVHPIWSQEIATSKDTRVTDPDDKDKLIPSPINSSDAYLNAKALVLKYLESFSRRDTFSGYTISGVQRIVPGGFFSAVAWFDTGDGLFTRGSVLPYVMCNYGTGAGSSENKTWHLTDPTLPYSIARESLHAPPQLARQAIPYERIIHGYLEPLSKTNNDITPIAPQEPNPNPNLPNTNTDPNLKPDPVTRNPGMLYPGDTGLLTVYAYHTDYTNKLAPTQTPEKLSIQVKAFNATTDCIPYYCDVTARYHLQAGDGGEWEIFSAPTKLPHWQSICVDAFTSPQLSLTPVTHVPTANLITVRRDSGLRLLSRNPGRTSSPAEGREAIIDVAPAPSCYVFTGTGPNSTPKWSGDVAPPGRLVARDWLDFSNGSGLGAGRTRVRLPNNPACHNAFLLSDSKGSCIQSKWFGPGLSLTMSVYGGPEQSLSQSAVTLTFKYGLLVAQTGLTESYAAEKPTTPVCRSVPVGLTSPCLDSADDISPLPCTNLPSLPSNQPTNCSDFSSPQPTTPPTTPPNPTPPSPPTTPPDGTTPIDDIPTTPTDPSSPPTTPPPTTPPPTTPSKFSYYVFTYAGENLEPGSPFYLGVLAQGTLFTIDDTPANKTKIDTLKAALGHACMSYRPTIQFHAYITYYSQAATVPTATLWSKWQEGINQPKTCPEFFS